jgi:hypothetical protein
MTSESYPDKFFDVLDPKAYASSLGPEFEAAVLALRITEWLDAPIVGHGLYARYVDAREFLAALVARPESKDASP